MIFTDRTIIVKNGTSSIDSTIVLYRGDRGVEIRFTLNEGSPFKFGSGTNSNIIEKTEATYGQLVIKTPGALPPIFSEVTPTIGGKIIFTITAEMIDETTEVGNYTFQIRLLDDNMESRATLPEVKNGIEIREPIALEDISTTNEVGEATVGYALTTAGTTEDAFDTQGNYNKTTWGTGDRITAAKLNKIEAGIDGVNQKVASGSTGGETGVDLSIYQTKTDNTLNTTNKTVSGAINEINEAMVIAEEQTGDITVGEVPVGGSNKASDITITDTAGNYTSNNVEGALQEVGSQIKEIENKKATKQELEVERGKISNINNKLQSFTLSDSGNLIDITLLEKGKKLNDDGTIIDRADASISPYIEIDKNNIYVYNFIADICFYDNSKTYISGYSFVNVNEDIPATLNIPDTGNVKYVRFNVWNDKAETSVFTLRQNYVKNLKCKYVYSGECERYDASIRPIKVWDKGNLLDINNLIDGYLLNSATGKLQERPGSKVTDFIEINKEDKYTFNFISNIGFYDTDKQFISGYDASTNNDNPIDLVIPEGDVKYVRMSIWTDQMKGYDVLALSTSFNKNLKHLYMYENVVSCTEGEKNYMENPLTGKSFIFFGDSWCAGNSSAGGGWADWLKRKNPSITVKNCGIHGSDWWQCYNKWFVVDKDTLPNNADYIIIEAYTNGLYVDVDQVAKPLGEVDEFTYYNSVDEIIALGDTFAVDLEKVLYSIVTKWNGKKIGLMFPYKSADMLRQNNAFRQFREQVFKCCRKYNIPVFDNFDSCNIPSWKQEYVDKYFWHGDDNREHGDGVHLNATGYDIICPPIENWLKTL